MTKQETDMGLFIVIALVLMAILSSTFLKVKNWFLQTFNKISTSVNNSIKYIQTHGILTILWIIFGLAVVYILYKIIKSIIDKINEKRERVENIKNELKEIEKHIKTRSNPGTVEEAIDSVSKKLQLCEDTNKLKGHIGLLKKKLLNLELLNEESRRKENINQLEIRERELDSRFAEKERKSREAEQNKQVLLRRLGIEENRVFKKSELRDKEIEALKEQDFEQVNQFDVLERKQISVLIKPYEKLNHSREHIFLVWSVKRFLESRRIERIEEHLTKGADITFKHNKKWFAIEIETGSMLEKSKRLKEKVDYLNRQYPNRWMFVVSNEKLVSRYAEFGLSTSRNRVPENLEKLLKNV
ncbi:MAG: hypothetical protein NTX24_02675 [Candidatus Pacearchaeota archaeon]|nr:hypothetical protein [Candidatus Pacearchaeota archaeon]